MDVDTSEDKTKSIPSKTQETPETKSNILYLFTSTEPPYHNDALDLLALPSDLPYRFRYDLKYLPDNLQKEDQLKAVSKALLIHVRTTPISKKVPADIIEHFPIREAKILDVKLVGNFVWIEFILGDWINYKDSQKNVHHNSIVELMPKFQKKELKNTLLLAPDHKLETLKEDLSEPYENSQVITSWSNLITQLMNLPEHENSIFLKFLSIEQIDDITKSTKLKPEELGNKIFGFKVSRGKTYRIEVLQRAKDNPNPKFDLEVFSKNEEISALKKTAKVQGKYDILNFIISIERLEQKRRSFFIIRPEKDTAEKFTVSRTRFNVEIKVPQNTKNLLIIGLGAGIFISGLGTVAENLTVLIPSAIGASLSAIALYFLRR